MGDPGDRERRVVFQPVGGQGEVIFLGLGVAGIALDLVDRRGHQPAGLGQDVEIADDAVHERPVAHIGAGRADRRR